MAKLASPVCGSGKESEGTRKLAGIPRVLQAQGKRGECLEVWDFQVGRTFGWARGAEASTMYQRRRHTQRLRRKHIVVNALADMQHTLRRQPKSLQGQVKRSQGRFVRLGLLRGNDLVKLDLQVPRASREEII